MAFAFRLCLALLGLISFLLSPVTSLAVDVQSAFPDGTESTSIPIPETDGKPWPDIQPIDPPDPPVPTELPVPTGTPFLIDTGLVVHVNAGQFFIIRLDKFIQAFFDGVEVYTNPGVSWIGVDSERQAIIGQVPKDYPTRRILVIITGRYRLNGSVINFAYIVALEVHGTAYKFWHFSLGIDTHNVSHHNSAHNSAYNSSHNHFSHNHFSHNHFSYNSFSYNDFSYNNFSHNYSSHTNDAADHLEDNSECFTKSDLVPEREVYYPLRPIQKVTQGHRYFDIDGAAFRLGSP